MNENEFDTNDNYFTVTPVAKRFEILEPGESYEGIITVINPVNATEDFNYTIYTSPYGVKGENYDADLITETDRTQIAKWITIDEPSGSLKPNESKTIHYTITVPADAPAGGQYAAIIVSKDNGSDKANGNMAVNNIFEMASLIYADVNGETILEGEILENNIPGFVTNAPITVSALISNNGNVHQDATIIIEANNFFTGEVILEAKENKDYYTELIMPGTTRYVQRDINEGLPALGVVHVEQTIYYNGGFSKEAKDVIICSVWFMAMVVATIAVIVAVIVGMVRRHRRKKVMVGVV